MHHSHVADNSSVLVTRIWLLVVMVSRKRSLHDGFIDESEDNYQFARK